MDKGLALTMLIWLACFSTKALSQVAIVDHAAASRWGVRELTLQDLPPVAGVPRQITVPISLDGERFAMSLAQHSLRAAAFTLIQSPHAAQAHQHAIRTYRGNIEGLAGSKVAASLNLDGQWSALIRHHERLWVVQPASGEAKTSHAVYRAEHVLPLDSSCETVAFAKEPRNEPANSSEGIAGTGPYLCEIAFDADVEFFQAHGASVENTVADIEAVLNAVALIFESEVEITFALTGVIVHTAEPDPYVATEADELLVELGEYWNVNQVDMVRDVAHLMTGKDIDGTVVGVASPSSICNTAASYSVSQSQFSLNFAARVALTAHELGHNFGAQHCNNDPDCGIMCSTMGGCSMSFVQFGSEPVSQIIAFRDSIDCLVEEPPAAQRLYVDASAPGGQNGLSWQTAKTSLQGALDVARAHPIVEEIWIATGVYRPGRPNGPRDACFELREDLAIYGAFVGVETELAQRTPYLYPTVLSGDLNGDDGPFLTHRDDNAYTVISAHRISGARLDGLTIRDGFCGAASSDCSGSGFVGQGSELALIDCIIEQNAGGPASHVDDCNVNFINCTFRGNTSGALSLEGGNTSLTNCAFIGNTQLASALPGAADVGAGASAKFVNCTFAANASASVDGGGAVRVIGDRASPAIAEFVNCIFWGNAAAGGSMQSQQVVINECCANATVNYSSIQGWTGSLGGVGNHGLDPLFADIDGPDDYPGNADDDVRILSGSPCTDAANNFAVPLDDFDLDFDGDTAERIPLDRGGRPRFIDDPDVPDTGNTDGVHAPIDMGCYEWFADCNGNHVLDSIDVARGSSDDANLNGIPDECECPVDLHDQTLEAIEGQPFDQVGAAVCVGDGEIFAGSPFNDALSLPDVGGVYCWQFINGHWLETQRILPERAVASMRFGAALACQGDVLVVGAPGSASAHVFQPMAGSWIQQQEILPTGIAPVASDFGLCIAMSGDVIIVGAPLDDPAGADSGSAFLFRLVNNVWVQEQKLVASDGNAGDRFGWSVGVSGDIVVVGSPQDDDLGTNAGAAYFFNYNGASWVQQQKVYAPPDATSAQFGTSVVISGDRAFAGSSAAAAVEQFAWQGTEWVSEPHIAPEGQAPFSFSRSIAFSDDALIAAAPSAGKMFVFHQRDSKWSQSKVVESVPPAFLGTSVATDGVIVAAGAPQLIAGNPGDGFVIVTTSHLDCNANNWADACEIQSGITPDVNDNGIPDDCDWWPCPADFTGDSVVNSEDLIRVIQEFGGLCPFGGCQTDIAPPGGNQIVDVDDLLAVINSWGACD